MYNNIYIITFGHRWKIPIPRRNNGFSITTSQSNDGIVFHPQNVCKLAPSELENTVYHVPLDMGNSLISLSFFSFFFDQCFSLFLSVGTNFSPDFHEVFTFHCLVHVQMFSVTWKQDLKISLSCFLIGEALTPFPG